MWRSRAQGLSNKILAIENDDLRDVVACIVDVLASGCGGLIFEDGTGDHVQIVGVHLDDECAAAIRARVGAVDNALLTEALVWLRGLLADQDIAFVAWSIGKLQRRSDGGSGDPVFEGPDGVGWDIDKHEPVTIVVDGRVQRMPSGVDLGL